MKNLFSVLIFSLLINLQGFAEKEFSIDLKKAHQYFMEAKRLADKDNGKLWGINLYGPIIFVDPQTRFAVANEADSLKILKKNGNVYTGYLKPEDGVANTAIHWAGKFWMMMMWNSLSDDISERTNLMMHELYHCIQEKIGLPIEADDNAHLDEINARIWLKMEWSALEKAVFSKGRIRNQAIHDALSFRNYRQKLFPGSRENECKLEINEGLAEYTGFKLSQLTPKDQLNYFKTVTVNRKKINSYVRAFAYLSGPLYGYLLDAKSNSWRKGLSSKSDFGNLLKDQYKIELEEENQLIIESKAIKYGFDSVFAFEQKREEKRLEKIKELTEKLVINPVLKLNLQKMGIQFDPRTVQPLKGYGTVYNIIRVTDIWGILDVTDDALMSDDWKTISVSVAGFKIKNGCVEGNGWKLILNEGWKIGNNGKNKILVH